MLYRAYLAAVLVSAAAVALTAQSSLDTARDEQQRPTFRTALDLVSVAVVVRGSDGRLVPDLRAEDFEVMDRGSAQPIVQFHHGRDADARLALLVDSSGSMVVGAKRQRSLLATEFLIASFKQSDAASVFSFDSSVRRLTPFTNDPEELRAAVTSVEPYGVTSIYDAIVDTMQTVVNDGSRARALLLLTDGLDTASVLSPGDAASAAGALDIPLYVLSVGDDRRPAVDPGDRRDAVALTLNELANRTGGRAAECATTAQLRLATSSILAELRHQYVIAIPAGSEKGWHELTVRVRRGRTQARSRNGYVVS